MFLNDIINADAMPALEMTTRFAAQRQRLIAHNIANVSTPDFVQKDVSVQGFRDTLAAAIDRRRASTGGLRGPLDWRQSDELRRADDGNLRLEPSTPSGNILFHDRNNRDVERLMQDQVENVAVFRLATELMRSHSELTRAAISLRV